MSGSGTNETIPCPRIIRDLVARFSQHLDSYRQQTYNETQVRREFIDPFFTALGWDVENKAGHAEAYKDVIHEDAIKVGGSTKAPDYCFRIGGVRKFFVEAKKPAVGVHDDPGPAYQLRRYAWTNKLPLSIVTDFEELAVYDCRVKPGAADKPSKARVLYITYDQYPEKWTEVASIFAKEAILKGSFDKYAESTKRKRGTTEVDAEFLKEIEAWRETLARNIALRNGDLSVRELNYAVAKIIDRIIFLRMCEDRGVETYEQLRVLPNGPRIYPRLVELFRRADERYNSGLFHFEQEKGRAEAPDELTPTLTVDDKVLKDIIKRLYYPDCPYEFSVLPAEILGQVYEQFLGKVIRLTKGHRAVVEEKPEVKKAGGVYYTPKYIVDYIVKHTVGKLLQGRTPADVGPNLLIKRRKHAQNRDRKGADYAHRSDTPLPNGRGSEKAYTLEGYAPLRILDPACGSGSFLLGAYQYLLDWHLKWYIENDPETWSRKRNPPIYQAAMPKPSRARKEAGKTHRDREGAAVTPTPDREGAATTPNPDREGGAKPIGNWRLTVAERKRILLNNIYGVDIDPQAVEVTKLSLLLKVLEGENQQTLDHQLRLFHERALPDLGDNIKCGNSLIGPDFYDNRQLDLLDEEERYRINAFDWEAEFPQVFGLSRASAPSRADTPSRARKEAVAPSSARKEAVKHSGVSKETNIPSPDRKGGDRVAPSSGQRPLPYGRGSESRPLPHGRGSEHPGGFDAVIGNPPYVLLQDEFRDDRQLAYFRSKFEVASYKLDTYHLFVERGISLARTGGRCAMITPANFLTNNYLVGMRRLFLDKTGIDHILIIEGGVFPGISVDNAGRVEVWRGGLGWAYLFPPLSSGGASIAHPCSVSRPRSSNRTCGFPASGSRRRHHAFAHGRLAVSFGKQTSPSTSCRYRSVNLALPWPCTLCLAHNH